MTTLGPIETADRVSGRATSPTAGPPWPQLLVVAHELRQPLGAILMALKIHDECGDESAAREARDITKRGALHMTRIIDDVLDMYRDAHGRPHLKLERVDLSSVVHDAILTAQPGFASRGHRLTVSLPPKPISLLADPSRLQQILTNLLTNAAKYTGPCGQICLTASVSTDVVDIRIRDNGSGISPDLLPRIFDPYQRRTDPGDGGLGLGLALVKSLVELHGGSVAANSSGLGMGSEFVVRLPARGPDARAEGIPR